MLAILLGCLSWSCSQSTGPKPSPPFFVALAGVDRESFVGGYVALEGSFMSSPPLDSLTYDWSQDEKNPEVLFLLPRERTQILGFRKEGTYRYMLRVRRGTAESEPDTVTIQVGPRRQHLFADPNLEITVRYSIRRPDGDLTQADLAAVDTLVPFTLGSISSLQGIGACTNLTFMQFSLQSITDLAPLSGCARLEFLWVDQNYGLKDLSPLSSLTSLRSLSINTDSVSNLAPLAPLRELRYLDVGMNPLSDISVVANFPNLESLLIGVLPQVTDISALKNATKLQMLYAFHCRISDISALAGHTELKYLDLWENSVTDISALAQSTKLTTLYLVDNKVNNVGALKGLPALAFVALPGNQVRNLLPLVENAGIGRGDFIDISHNPLDTISVNQYIPALRARGVSVLYP